MLDNVIQFGALVLVPLLVSLGAIWNNNRVQENEQKKVNAKQTHDRNQHEVLFQAHISAEVAILRERADLLQEKNEALLKELVHLKAQYAGLEAQFNFKISLFESAHQELPIPMWLKDEKGRVLSCNKAYEVVFLHPRGFSVKDYEGHDDSNVWPEEIARTFSINDKNVYDTGRTWIGHEDVPDGEGVVHKWRIIKYLRTAGPIKLGIAGIAWPDDPAAVVL